MISGDMIVCSELLVFLSITTYADEMIYVYTFK